MELKLVYRILRKISDWTIAGYYSEVYVEDQNIITEKDPVIIAATHHNDIIDVAALAATINHRRPISFWAKSTLFSNPVAGAILSSSGTIPVRRNPNIGNNASTANPSRPASTDGKAPSPPSVEITKEAELSARAALFLTTSQVIGAGQVVGVFCEGASYTASRILQVLPGTAWAAVEYARYLNEKRKQATGRGYSDGPRRRLDSRLCIVPVAIEYTDKSQYLSRIYIRYGIPIYLDSFTKELFRGDTNEASKAVVKTITAQLEERLIKITVNIQDWETLCAVSIARDILWGDEHNVPLKDWVDVMQRLGRMLETPGISKERSTSESDSVRVLKDLLTRYYALLHYAGMKHSVLSSLLPLATPPASATDSTEEVDPLLPAPKLGGKLIARATVSILMSLPLSLIRFVLFIPPFLLHLPGYFVGPFLARLLATPGEVETIAQYKAIGGGLGIAANVILAFGILWRKNNLGRLGTLLGLARDDRPLSASLRVLGLVGTVYCSVVLLVKWHKLLIRANYTQLQRILTYWKLVSAYIFPDSLLAAQVEAYTKPEHPAVNLWVRDRIRKTTSSANGGLSNANFEGSALEEQAQTQPEAPHLPKPRPIPSRKLVRHVLHARTAASTALWAHLDRTADRDLVAFLNLKGAKFPGSREPFW